MFYFQMYFFACSPTFKLFSKLLYSTQRVCFISVPIAKVSIPARMNDDLLHADELLTAVKLVQVILTNHHTEVTWIITIKDNKWTFGHF